MNATPASPSPDPNNHEENQAKGTRKVRNDRSEAKDEAFRHLRAWRCHLIARFQYAMFDWLLEHGTCYVPDLSDAFDSPPKVRRVFIGTAVNDLAEDRIISPTGERRSTTQGGRHGNIYEVWRLAPGVDAARVDEWKRTRPIPPPPQGDFEPAPNE